MQTEETFSLRSPGVGPHSIGSGQDAADRPKKTGYTVESALLNQRNQKCKVFDREVIPQAIIKKVNDI